MSEFKTVWFWDSGNELIPNFKHVMSFYDDTYPKPNLITGIKQPDHSSCHSFNYLDRDNRLCVALVGDQYSGVLPLWYVRVYADNSVPPMRTVLAFADSRFPDGTILTYKEAVELEVDPSQSCGFIKWFKNDSSVQQIFVAEQHRRKRISTKLFGIADLLIVSDINWNQIFLNGGHVTTQDGEKLRAKWNASGSTRLVERIGSVEELPVTDGSV